MNSCTAAIYFVQETKAADVTDPPAFHSASSGSKILFPVSKNPKRWIGGFGADGAQMMNACPLSVSALPRK